MLIDRDAQVDPLSSSVFHRELDKTYPVIVRGAGCHLWDSSGREYLDAVGGGAAVAVIGYGNQHVLDVAGRQLAELPFVHNAKFTNLPQETLAERLAAHAPEGINRAFFVQGGAEANEAALRLVRKYHVDRGEPDRDVVVTQAASYHGSTIGTLALSGRKALQHPVEPWLPPFEHVMPFHCYRCPYGREYGSCGIECAKALDAVAERVGPERIAAFMMEAVPLSAAPGLVPPPEFLPMVREWCDRVGALLVLDEVVTGMGRTGRWFASEHWGIVPDAFTVAKGLGAGYSPIGALLVHDRVFDAVNSGSREFEHGHTLNGNPVSCAVAGAVLDVIEDEALVQRSEKLGAWLEEELAERLADVDAVGEVRGLGTLIGIEYVAGRATRSILDPALRFGATLQARALDEGLVVSGSLNNKEVYVGECTTLAPAYTMTDSEAEEVVARLDRAVRATVRDLLPHSSASCLPLSLGQGHPASSGSGSDG